MKKLKLDYLILAVINLIIIIITLNVGNIVTLDIFVIGTATFAMCITALMAGYTGFVKEGHYINL